MDAGVDQGTPSKGPTCTCAYPRLSSLSKSLECHNRRPAGHPLTPQNVPFPAPHARGPAPAIPSDTLLGGWIRGHLQTVPPHDMHGHVARATDVRRGPRVLLGSSPMECTAQ